MKERRQEKHTCHQATTDFCCYYLIHVQPGPASQSNNMAKGEEHRFPSLSSKSCSVLLPQFHQGPETSNGKGKGKGLRNQTVAWVRMFLVCFHICAGKSFSDKLVLLIQEEQEKASTEGQLFRYLFSVTSWMRRCSDGRQVRCPHQRPGVEPQLQVKAWILCWMFSLSSIFN